jgi:hypothetical protein
MPSSAPALMCVVRIGQCRRQCGGRRGVANQSHRERGHLPNLGIGITLQQRGQRRQRLGKLDAPDRERRPAADARLGIIEQREQITTASPQLPRVLELEDPAHLLFERGLNLLLHLGSGRRLRRASRCDCAQDDDNPGPQISHVHRLTCRSVAWSTRSRTMLTPMPGAVGTAIVPSLAMSIAGSIKSGW